jgi:hypothetical protein
MKRRLFTEDFARDIDIRVCQVLGALWPMWDKDNGKGKALIINMRPRKLPMTLADTAIFLTPDESCDQLPQWRACRFKNSISQET